MFVLSGMVTIGKVEVKKVRELIWRTEEFLF